MWGCPPAGLRAHSRPEIGTVQQETTEVHGAVDRITEWDVAMDYETMKAFMEASRAESSAQGKLQVKEFPKPDSKPDWKYLNQVPKERMAA